MTPGVIFDLDETLYPERQFIRSGFRAVARTAAHDCGLDRAAVRGCLLGALRAGRRARALQALCEHFALPARYVPEWVDVIRHHAPALRLPLESRETLSRARRAGWRVGILTNGRPDIQRRKVAALGIEPLVDAVVFAEEWGAGHGKPEREPFDQVRASLGTEAAATVVIGDDIWCDIAGGSMAGMRTVLVRRPGSAPRPGSADRVAATVAEAFAAAESLVRGDTR